MKLQKYEGNPIVSPNEANEWESLVTTNPGAWYDEDTGEFILLYRVAGKDAEHRINIALATSKDGFNFERKSKQPLFPTYEGGWDCGAIEDPRIVKYGEYYFITYATVPYFPGRYWENTTGPRNSPDVSEDAPFILRHNQTRTGLAITKDFKTIYRPGSLTDSTVDDRDVILFPEKVNGKFVLLHRPMQWVGEQYGTEHPAMWISYCDDLLEHKVPTMLAKAEYEWEDKIGGSTPPLKTEHGWFVIYHAVGQDKIYRVGVMMLDLENPSRVTHRVPTPIMEPEHDYEMEGIYKGICFPCGNVVKDDRLYVYYGGADQYVGVATCSFSEMIDYVLKFPVN
ncbi:MAG: hypothetical protein FWD05_02825 [Oscillospiraceae bacterium]|nr:hypothetical protein [Oscillospiraceae bacterium]